ncbi:structural maintenance of chromosomes protein 1A-like [Oscarella lobularis]|uniref:structural maintenance of chromosomes protein 1A-like n=1 Tax=Oscarella lobularis TaxID=121494 RepID=UPI003313C502
MGLLRLLEVQNFKSYRGLHRIGPFRDFQGIVGPNGSGKSNLMDAISFVFGERTGNLRVKHATDLIHGAPSGNPVDELAFVSAVCFLDDTEIHLRRQITRSGMTYKLNGKTVSAEAYNRQLRELGIDANGRNSNFLIYQGEVEKIAMKDPEEVTVLLEKISGSAEEIPQYNQKRDEWNKAEKVVQDTMEAKKSAYIGRREAKANKELADRYGDLLKSKDNTRLAVEVAKLSQVEESIETLKNEKTRAKASVDEIKKDQEKLVKNLAEKKANFGKFAGKIGSLQQGIKKEEEELDGLMAQHSKETKKLEYYERRKKDLTKKCNDAREERERKSEMQTTMERAMNESKRQLEELEGEMMTESQEERIRVSLEDGQVRAYREIKENVSRRTAKVNDELEELRRERQSAEMRLERDEARLRSEEEHVEQLKNHFENLKRHRKRLNDYLDVNKEETDRVRGTLAQLESDLAKLDEEEAELRNKHDELARRLADVQVDRREEERMQRRLETVEKLKGLCPGVYGRMYELCKPRHERYKLALTKALISYMDAIVVDTDETAKTCVRHLKEQQLDVETFLPLSSLKATPIDNKLRSIPNAKLLIDCVEFSPQDVQKAVQFCLGNVMVCETVDQAKRVAFGAGGRRRNVVAYNGVMLYEYGGVSGGISRELRSKARRFEEGTVDQLRRKTTAAFERVRQVVRNRVQMPNLDDVNARLNDLVQRRNFIENDLKKTDEDNVRSKREITAAKKGVEKLKSDVEDLRRQFQSREGEIERLQEQLNRVEDEQFSDFCEEIGVRNIREFEKGALKVHEEKMTRVKDCKARIANFSQQLSYLKKSDAESVIQKAETDIRTCEKDVDKARVAAAQLQATIKDLKSSLAEAVKKRDELKEEQNEKEDALKRAREAIKGSLRAIAEAERRLQAVLRHLDEKRAARHHILKTCKLEGIPLPMLEGSFDDVPLGDHIDVGTSAGSSSATASTAASADDDTLASSKEARAVYRQESVIEIDYSRLEKLRRGDRRPLDQWIAEKNADIVNLESSLQELGSYDTHAEDKVKEAIERYDKAERSHTGALEQSKKAKVEFERVKATRREKFMEAFEIIKDKVNVIYKKIWAEPGAQAVLFADDPEEPYLGAVNYHCIPPGKSFLPMKDLSGGEKSISALALVFALKSVHHPRLFVLDEVDAALDKDNVGKLAHYIKEETRDGSLQCIIISLKLEAFQQSDALVGVTAELGGQRGPVSSLLTLDLSRY